MTTSNEGHIVVNAPEVSTEVSESDRIYIEMTWTDMPGKSLSGTSPLVKDTNMVREFKDEAEHLAWCAERMSELRIQHPTAIVRLVRIKGTVTTVVTREYTEEDISQLAVEAAGDAFRADLKARMTRMAENA